MRPTLWQRMDLTARHLLPVLLTLALLLLSMVPSHAPGMVRIGPMLTLAAVYYWAVNRPDLMGYGAVFTVGVVEDLLAGTPLGVSALTLLLVHFVVVNQYKFFYAKPFVVGWAAFVVVAGVAALVKWAAVGLLALVPVDPSATFHAYLMTVALYPMIGWLLARLQLLLLREV